jgi:hypothetical protein
MIGILLVAFIGVPVLIIARDNTNSRVFVTSGIIFVMCSLILLLIFVPKIQYERSAKSDRPGLNTHISGLDMSTSIGGFLHSGTGRVPESVHLSGPSIMSGMDDESESGERVLSSKTQSELVSQVAALKRYIQLLKARVETQSASHSSNIINEENDSVIHVRQSLVHFADFDGEHHDSGAFTTLLCSDDARRVRVGLDGTAATKHGKEKKPPLNVTTLSNSAKEKGPDPTDTQRQDPESHPLSEERQDPEAHPLSGEQS